MKEYTTVEYTLPGQAEKPVFLIVVDTCVEEAELVEVKDSLQQSLNLIPEDALVGLVTYGRHVFVHELGSNGFPKSFVFRGDVEKTPQQIQEALRILNTGDPKAVKNLQKFLVPVSECEESLNSILDDLQPDPWPTGQGCRPLRATGNAMAISIALLEMLKGNRGSRIISIIGGCCTTGPGKVSSDKLTDTLRSHLDIQREKAPFLKDAMKYYDSLA